jgi:outer membrane biosynthesis protein TonB
MDLSQKDVKKPTEKAISEVIPSTKNEAQAKNAQNVKDAPKVVDKNKGSLDIPAEKAPVNRTGFLAALKKNKNVGMVKADQVLDKGIVNETLSGKSGDFVLEQSASGVVNNQIRKNGDTLSAASTKVNMKDRVGSGSLNVDKGDVLKEGFKANYGVSGEGGLIESNFGDQLGAQVEGGLDKDSVRQAILGFKQEIRGCFEQALLVKSNVNGRVSYRFQISAKGTVEWIKLEKSSVDSQTLVNCVQKVVNNVKFPEAKNGQKTIVIYPFQFARKGSK